MAKRERLNKLFELQWETNPKTGKPKRVAKYIGKFYALDMARRNKLRAALIVEGVLALAAFCAGGMINNTGSHIGWVAVFYGLSLLPIAYYLFGVVKLACIKGKMTQMDLEDGLQRGMRSAVGMTLLGAAWLIADVVDLCLYGAGGQLGRELLFMGCAAVIGALGVVSWKQLKSIGCTEIAQEGRAAEAEDGKQKQG